MTKLAPGILIVLISIAFWGPDMAVATEKPSSIASSANQLKVDDRFEEDSRRALESRKYLNLYPLGYMETRHSQSRGCGSCIHIVDLTEEESDSRDYYVLFCSRKSANFLGFPGHCFVGWSDSLPVPPLSKLDTAGLFPENRTRVTRLKSIFFRVPAALRSEPVPDRIFDLDCGLIVKVNKEAYQGSRDLRDNWAGRSFRVGGSDCVTFCDVIARYLGLQIPRHKYRFPRGYISSLRKLN